MSQKEIEESLNLLQKDWEIEPVIQEFVLGKRTDVADHAVKVKDVVFHIPFLTGEKNLFYGNVIGLTVIIAVIDKDVFL